MFSSSRWSKVSEIAYGYPTKSFEVEGNFFHYSHVNNDIGEYIILPSFGDYIESPPSLDFLDKFSKQSNGLPIKIKLCSNKMPVCKDFSVLKSGFIHQIRFKSHKEWRDKIIKYKFRNKIVQAENKGIKTKIVNDLESLNEFYKIHSLLRINKFKEIPQPWKFFEAIYNSYFKVNKGFLINACSPEKKLIAGILCIIEKENLFYKFNASVPESLKYRPNNILLNDLVEHCSSVGIKCIDLGFTGEAEEYKGLRSYKLNSGAVELSRFIIKNKLFDNLNFNKIKQINLDVKKLISAPYTLEEIDKFSGKYYKYFI